ncbi:TIGR02530 family flagellar biosynthesis protein [Lawsonibacter sp. LCP25S3_G6]|uniref:TIGR02530 family flagellar biosynthesis protein n=1 Tax=unclassified Lawsonibacter TaxID=2617946 RepID=UPI003F9920C0
MVGPIYRVGGSGGLGQTEPRTRQTTQSSDSFDSVLQQQMACTQTRQVAFSKHALSRAEERGIEVTPTLLERLGDSVERAQAKGATNILALDQTLAAFIVNVPNNRVITAMSQSEMKENIFTNIDGAVFL